MTDVIDLNERRRRRELEMKTLWQCSSCGGNEFLLATDGAVVCVTCQEVIEDLQVMGLDDRG